MMYRVSPFSRFARFQSATDLAAIAAATAPAHFVTMIARIPGLPPPEGLVAVASRQACLDAQTVAYSPALELAATLPGEDARGFVAATALLLADRLKGGAGTASLYWHYDAHASAYAALAPDPRSAILMGFFLLHDMGRVTLDAPPSAEARSARPGGLVRAALTAAPPHAARAFKAALVGGDLAETEAMWREAAAELAPVPSLAGAARRLYTAQPAWDPYRDWPERRIAAEGIAIPFPCALPLPHGTD